MGMIFFRNPFEANVTKEGGWWPNKYKIGAGHPHQAEAQRPRPAMPTDPALQQRILARYSGSGGLHQCGAFTRKWEACLADPSAAIAESKALAAKAHGHGHGHDDGHGHGHGHVEEQPRKRRHTLDPLPDAGHHVHHASHDEHPCEAIWKRAADCLGITVHTLGNALGQTIAQDPHTLSHH